MSHKKPEGLFEYLILKILEDEESYGYELIKKIKNLAGGYWDPSYGTIYGTLSRLQEKEHIKRIEKNHEDRKYFEITEKGKKRLEQYDRKELRQKSEEIVLGLLNIYRKFNDKTKFLDLVK